MSTDYGEKERQFLETLKADTGRAIDEWMKAIATQGLAERNEIIDWLRRQGFMFSKASWIERIHNNGGRPIYADTGARRERAHARSALPHRRPAQPTDVSAPNSPAIAIQLVAPSVVVEPPVSPATVSSPRAEIDPAALEALLGRAKAYRPLAVYVIAEIKKAVPSASVQLIDGGLSFRTTEHIFAALAVTSKDLKLGLALSSPTPGLTLDTARLGLRAAPPMSQRSVLTDARQINSQLIAAVIRAASGG